MLRIDLASETPAYEPGDEVRGTVRWMRAFKPEAVELKLLWMTSGRGSEDVEVVDSVAFENPEMEGTRSFRLNLPDAPCSFSGKLISLGWVVELVTRPEDAAERVSIVVGPNKEEVRLFR